jgi:hypothetical protein
MSLAGLAGFLVQQPANILVVAACHAALWALCQATVTRGSPRANVLWVPAVLWLAHAAWEWLVLVKTPEADIRVDLLLIWPLIAIVTLWAVARTARGAWSSRRQRR